MSCREEAFKVHHLIRLFISFLLSCPCSFLSLSLNGVFLLETRREPSPESIFSTLLSFSPTFYFSIKLNLAGKAVILLWIPDNLLFLSPLFGPFFESSLTLFDSSFISWNTSCVDHIKETGMLLRKGSASASLCI